MRQSIKAGLAVFGAGIFAVIALGPGLLNGQKGPIVEKDGGIKAPEGKKEKGNEGFEVRSIVSYQDKVLIGTKHSLFEVSGEKLAPWGNYPGEEARALATTKGGALLVGDKHALWRFESGAWTKVGEWDPHGFAQDSSGAILMAAKKEGVFKSDDEGKTWRSVALEIPAEYKKQAPDKKEGYDKPKDKDKDKD